MTPSSSITWNPKEFLSVQRVIWYLSPRLLSVLSEAQRDGGTPRWRGGGGGGEVEGYSQKYFVGAWFTWLFKLPALRLALPAFQNPYRPYPIYDQSLRFSIPYLWPDRKFDTPLDPHIPTVRGTINRSFLDNYNWLECYTCVMSKRPWYSECIVVKGKKCSARFTYYVHANCKIVNKGYVCPLQLPVVVFFFSDLRERVSKLNFEPTLSHDVLIHWIVHMIIDGSCPIQACRSAQSNSLQAPGKGNEQLLIIYYCIRPL